MVTRVVAKQAKTTKVKNSFINGKKFKRIFSCLFGGRRKVQFRRKSSGEKFKFAFNRTSSLLSVLLRTRLAHRLSLQHFAAVLMPNIVELVIAFWFFLSTAMVFAAENTFCQEKHQHFHADRQLVTEKGINSNIDICYQR